MRRQLLVFAGRILHLAQLVNITLDRRKLVEASTRLFRQSELLDRGIQVALPGIAIGLCLMLLQGLALHRIGPGLQVVQRGVVGVAGNLFGKQLDGDFRLLVLQQQVGVVINQRAVIGEILYRGPIERQRRCILLFGAQYLPFKGRYHVVVAGRG